jgi:hypothetical protein
MISFTGGRNAVNSPSGELLLRQQQRGLKRLAPRVLDERENTRLGEVNPVSPHRGRI